MSTTNRLTRAQLEELQAELAGERDRLERSIMATAPAYETSATDSDVTIATQGSIGLAVESRARVRYDAINDALDRLASGRYGMCARCEDPIPYGRLIVMPEVSHCVTCSAHA